ncbi:MAG: phage holin family protein [Bacteroidetes bacterium]|nr:phage holin family protein [Bacteroidota bacterium]
MEKSYLEENVTEAVDATRKYVEAYIKLFKLELLERLSRVVSLVITNTLILMVAALFVLFLSLSAAIFIGHLMHSMELGFLIMSALFLMLIAVIWVFRGKLLLNPVIKSLNSILFSEDEKADDED